MEYTILSVDSLGITGMEILNMLDNPNIHIKEAKDKNEAINMLNDNTAKVSAVIWAVNSAECSEFSDIKELRKNESYKHIPIIVVSAYTGKSYIVKAIECGAAEYIVKPYDVNTVIGKIKKVLGISRDDYSRLLYEDIVMFNLSDMLNREIKAAARGGYPLCLLLAAVVADSKEGQYEHSSRGAAEALGKVVRARFRQTDAVFTYGSDSIILLLPFTVSGEIKDVERKLEDCFYKHAFVKNKSKGYRLIMSSVSFPEDGRTKERLLEKLKSGLRDSMNI